MRKGAKRKNEREERMVRVQEKRERKEGEDGTANVQLSEEDKKILEEIEKTKKDLEQQLLSLKSKLPAQEKKPTGDTTTTQTNGKTTKKKTTKKTSKKTTKRKRSDKKANKREKRMKKEHERLKRSSLSKSGTVTQQPLPPLIQTNITVSNEPHTAETPVEQLIPTDFHFFVWMVSGRVRCRISPSWIAPKVDQKNVATHIAAKFALEPLDNVYESGVYQPINKREKIADVRNRLMNSGFIEDFGLDPDFK